MSQGASERVPAQVDVLRDRVVSAGRTAAEALLEALSPTRCVCCERPGALICDACLERLPLIDPVEACTRCGAPFGALLCTECRDARSVAQRCLATATFAGAPASIIRAYKDAGERRLGALIAQMLLDTALHAQAAAPERYGGLLDDADAIAFVPATSRARLRRGFDHMEDIARELARISGVPVVHALVKRGDGDQRLLGRSGRAAHAAGAFAVVEPVRGARVLLVDDVITTGATLRAAADALARAHAVQVDALAFARVW